MLDFEKSNPEQKKAAEDAVKNQALLLSLFDGLLSKSKDVRYENFKVLYLLSKQNPEALYNRWSFFEDFLKSGDDSKRFYAIHILANLTKVDTKKKFEGIFDDFYGILKGDSFINAGHVAHVSAKIVAAKTELAGRVAERLLDVEGVRYKHPELVKANAVASLSEFYDKVPDKEKVTSFVLELKAEKSPRAKKEAVAFIKKWGIK